MNVTKRDGSVQEVSFDKVTKRLRCLCNMDPPLTNINYTEIAQKVITRIYNNVHTYELDNLAAEHCTQKGTEHIEYSILASRIAVSNNHKLTSPSFSETITVLYNNKDMNGLSVPLISESVFNFVMSNKSKLNDIIDYSRDYNFDFFALKTLEKAYLMRVNNVVVERIQHLLMRVCVGLYDTIPDVIENYEYLSKKYFTHATPTLFHCGTPRPQLLSCFLLEVPDSVEGMYDAMKNCALISKWAGGIGCHIHGIRANNSLIRSTNGKSNGLIPMLKVFNDIARHINQSGKRNGSFAMYLEPWHPDILDFLECKKNHGDENSRARDLFYAIWTPDLFMKRVIAGENWSLMCPDRCKGLSDTYGDEFEALYTKYEQNPDNILRSLPAQEIWKKILASQKETGTPYICYKDACNIKSNQKNLGTIKSSNLCTEIIEYSNKDEYACCTLASIALSKFIIPFDYSTIDKVDIYSIQNCQSCKYSKNLLQSKNITYNEILINIDNDDELSDLETKLGITDISFPQITINNNLIGGFNNLYKYLTPSYDYEKLIKVTKRIVKNLNRVIDINYYPIIETKRSNLKHRPLGIGVQGLADVYAMFKCSFDSELASKLNKQIFACIYYAACESSMEISKNRHDDMKNLQKLYKNVEIPELYSSDFESDTDGDLLYHKLKPIKLELNKDTHLGSYSSFENSPISEGKFQFDLWNSQPEISFENINLDWETLRSNIITHGVRNSLLLAPMPTASTSQILGNNECIEPFTSNIYSRGTIAGQFLIVNKHLQQDLLDIGIWNKNLKDTIILENGSIQNIKQIPQMYRGIYKIAWDLSMKSLIDQAADRGIYVCQSQSLNLWMEAPTDNKLSSMHIYSWKKGLKTGIYYLRRRAISKAQTFSIDPEQEDCLMCGS